MDGQHLVPDAREQLGQKSEVRIASVEQIVSRGIGHKQFENWAQQLKALCYGPKSEIVVISGPPRNGKTTLLNYVLKHGQLDKKFEELEEFVGYRDPETDLDVLPSIRFDAKTTMRISTLEAELANPFVAGRDIDIKGQRKLIRIIEEAQVKRIAVDRAERLFDDAYTTVRDSKKMLGLLLDLHQDQGITIVLVIDQLSVAHLDRNRTFRDLAHLIELPRWETDSDHNKSYGSLLLSVDRVFPFPDSSPVLNAKHPNHDRAAANDLLLASDCRIGPLMENLKNAAKFAIESSLRQINREVFRGIGIKIGHQLIAKQ